MKESRTNRIPLTRAVEMVDAKVERLTQEFHRSSERQTR
jgi:hypothetical protein